MFLKAIILVWLILLLAPAAPLTEARAADVAIIVSRDNPVDELQWKELVKIFRLEKPYWDHHERVYLVLRETGSPEKSVVLDKIYRTSDAGLKRLWLGKINREEMIEFPRVLNSNEAVIRFVSQVPSAIGFVDASSADDRVKIVRIDGLLPGSDGYPLRLR